MKKIPATLVLALLASTATATDITCQLDRARDAQERAQDSYDRACGMLED